MKKKISSTVLVKNKQGLHARPATAIVRLLQNSDCDVTFKHKKEEVNAKSMLSILMLAAGKNSKITIEVEGEDAEETLAKLVNAFDNQFEE